MSTRRKLLGIGEEEKEVEKVSIVPQLVPDFKVITVDTAGRTFLDNYNRIGIESESHIVPAQNMLLVLGADAFLDPNHVIGRLDILRLREDSPQTLQIISDAVDNIKKKIVEAEQIDPDVVDVRIALIDRGIRRVCEEACQDVRAWGGVTIPVRYSATDIRLGIHSVEIKRALDVNGVPTVQGVEHIARVTFCMYSDTQYQLNLIMPRQA